jgi:arsenite-transporting ATPase
MPSKSTPLTGSMNSRSATLTAGSNWEVQFDREAMQQLISLAPPGIDEIAALSAVSDFLERGTYTSVILDTAPTGHLLRFLELPAVALDWVRTLLRLLLKYREVVTSSAVAEELIKLSKDIKRVIAVLTSAKDCEFLAVTIPERMSLAETGRLIDGVTKLRVNFTQIIINNVIPKSATVSCRFCAGRALTQQKHVEAFRSEYASRAELVIAPQHVSEIRGPVRLREFLQSWTPVVVSVRARKKKAAKSEG